MNPVRPVDAHWLVLWAFFSSGCVFDSFAEPGSQIMLDTGAQTTDASQGDDTGHDTGTSSADSSSTGSARGDTDTSSETGDPPDPQTTDASDSDSDTGTDTELCGNGVLDPGEQCDGLLLTADACATIDAVYSEGAPLCDAATCRFDLTPCITCAAPQLEPCDADSDDPFHALGLGCDTLGGWDLANAVPLVQHAIHSPDPTAYRVVTRFGAHKSAWTPRAGHRALLIGTGTFNKPDANGVVTAAPGSANLGGDNGNPDSKGPLPEFMRIRPVDGGSAPFTACDGVHDCSNTLAGQWDALPKHIASDIFYLELETLVPAGTHGYAIDLAFFTAHYPKFKDSSYQDMLVLWSQSEAYVGNVSYLRDGDKYKPLTLPDLGKAGGSLYDGAVHSELAGTGYDGIDKTQGGATGWLTIEGPAVPGESLILALSLMDLDNSGYDSAILVDNFRWRCDGCDLADGCGVRPAD